jgi:hypothetical protein
MVYFDMQLGRYGDAVPLGRIVMELKVKSCSVRRHLKAA